MYKTNLLNILKYSTPSDVSEGTQWYKSARLYAFELSKETGISFAKVCGIIAALSPRNKWDRNKIDARNLILWQQGVIALPRFATYGALVRKAVSIFQCENPTEKAIAELLNGPKITTFFLNIYSSHHGCVTVDSWIALAARGEYLSTDERLSVGKPFIREVQSVIQDIANERAMRACDVQAIIWVTFKRLVESEGVKKVA